MRSLVTSLVRQYLFWMVFFAALRLTFILYQLPIIKAENIPAGEVLSTFWHALLHDTSAACYLLIIPLFLLVIQGLLGFNWINWINKAYTFIMAGVYSLVTAIELQLYPEWKSKLNAKALSNLHHPGEAVQSIPLWMVVLLAGIFLLLTLAGAFIYHRIFYPDLRKKIRPAIYPILFLLVFAPLLFLGIRGGTGAIPITQSAAHFSSHPVLNWAAVNSGPNLYVSVAESRKYNYENPFVFYSQEEAAATVAALHCCPGDSTVRIIRNDRPNIVILLLESWTADLVESLGGKPGISPRFAELEKEGLLFTSFYASGNRSQQAMATLFGGFPALPYTTITENPDKFSRLPSLVRLLDSAGYHSSFYFGGQLNYGNIRAYLLSAGFRHIIEGKDISGELPSGRLGVHDGYLLDLHAGHAAGFPEPFFSVVFTLSSHSPYDQPMEPVLEWGTTEDQFINSAYYTDRSLGEYFDKARKQPWFENTLFVILADHSHNSYRNWPLESFEYHKVPLLLCGGALKDEWRGKTIGRISSNVDVAVTLLSQLGMGRNDFGWGNDLFNPASPEFAFFEINDGVGWKTPEGEFVYNKPGDRYYVLKYADGLPAERQQKLIRDGRSYIQVVFQSFLDM